MENKKPQMVIGTETEYGICVDAERVQSDHSLLADIFIEKMLDMCQEICANSFGGSRETIESLEEHSFAEMLNFLRRPREGLSRREELKQLRQQREHRQRRGYTGIMLPNGSRFYRDMSHPELSTPEVSNPYDAVVSQRAGDDLVLLCKKKAEERFCEEYPKGSVCIRKNNSDGKGNSYGGHENYMLSPDLFRIIFEAGDGEMFTEVFDLERIHPLVHAIFLFFVARQIIIGAGKVGSENETETDYQISARSDFFIRPFSLDTTHKRGIINLRDSPYTNHTLVRRFHVILADSNMSEVSLYLKYGMGGLFFMMLNSGFLEKDSTTFFHPLLDPVDSLQAVSRDLTLQRKLVFADGTRLTAFDVMKSFAASARRFMELYELSSAWGNVVSMLENALKGLEGNRHKHGVSRSLDWVAKERLLRAFCKTEQMHMRDNAVKLLSHNYHVIDTESGVFYKMEKAGEIIRLTSPKEVRDAQTYAPTDTRAWLRGEIIKRYGKELQYVKWDSIEFGNHGRRLINIQHPLAGTREKAVALFEGDPTFSEFLERLKNFPIEHVCLWPEDNNSREGRPTDA